MRSSGLRIVLAVVLSLALGLLGLDVLGFWWLRDNGADVRFIVVDDLAAVDPPQPFERGAAGFAREFPGADPLEILASVMNRVAAVESGPSGDPQVTLEHVRNGGGLVCSGMATLYAAALHDAGYRARIVSLRRNILDPYDSHTTVEVFLDGAWRLIDPTFGVSWVRNGEILSAWQVRAETLEGDLDSVEVVSHGEFVYPASLGDYYMDWPLLFNNVRVYASGEADPSWRGKLARLPPARYWTGPRFYMQYDPIHAPSPLVRYHNGVYFTLMAAFPIAIIALGLTAAALGFILFRRRRDDAPGEESE